MHFFNKVKEQKSQSLDEWHVFQILWDYYNFWQNYAKKTQKVPKIPLFLTTNYLQTTICINMINTKITYHMPKYVVIEMEKNWWVYHLNWSVDLKYKSIWFDNMDRNAMLEDAQLPLTF